ncbi:hypothetical protein BJ138DRAFT_1128829 [Hygrophoropsis aurantiaca]|uniref:Uncharacterized protein n=1 Tax=Hygrophoropsis aurantiaca TaxID=72124 RepID=A0ACB8A561_9AGAM|nr:hypothetical protein BJ138DRAFT_1128829 [Hygrophoropsis aurantiaca]
MADSALIQELQTIQTQYYVIVAAGALVAYDQVLTFSQEVDLIWNRKWSFMTALYLIARYFGSLSAIGNAVWYTYINLTYSVNVNMYLAVNWANNIFVLAMQAVLVIRIYALFDQSKAVLIVLATCYALQAITGIVFAGFSLNTWITHEYIVALGPAYGSVGQIPILNPSVFRLPVQDCAFPPVVFDTVLLFFALWAFVKHALEGKRVDGGWSVNVLVRTLVADHLMYFVCYLTWLSLNLAINYMTTGYIQLVDILNVFNALAILSGPRMVISLRAMENQTRREGGTWEGELSTVCFDTREPLARSQSVMEDGVLVYRPAIPGEHEGECGNFNMRSG